MNIVSLTPGAAGMYCGGCLRDNALTAALRRMGHDALLMPLYTPLTTDESDQSHAKIHFGGVNVYLQQKSKFARSKNLPEWLDRKIDSAGFLRFATGFGIKTNPAQLGEMTVSMLQGDDGLQARELDKLAKWLKENTRPDVICLSNGLMAGLAKRLRAELKVPVVCTLQGEDYFLDNLPEAYREKAWNLLRGCAEHVSAFVAVSHYYAGTMAARLKLPPGKICAVHNGIDLRDYAPAPHPPAFPTIVYLARMAPEKGLRTLIDAFKLLKSRNAFPGLSLRIGGSLTANDKPFVKALQADLKRAGLSHDVEFLSNLDKQQKIELLQSGSVFSVPATYGEAFGLFVLEALACGVPVVQPRHGAFPEVLAETGGGILCEPDNAANLADNLAQLLAHPQKAAQMGAEGRQRVLEKFSVERMAGDVLKVFATVTADGVSG